MGERDRGDYSISENLLVDEINICTISVRYLKIISTVYDNIWNLYNLHTTFVQFAVNVLEDNLTIWTIFVP